MDDVVEMGSNWFCTAVHVVNASSLEMQICGGSDQRYTVGVVSVAAVSLLVVWTILRLVRNARV